MNVSITPELQLKVEGLVKTGDYGSSSEVVRAALRLFFEHNDARQDHLRAMYAGMATSLAQIKTGDVVDTDDVIEEARRRVASATAQGDATLTP